MRIGIVRHLYEDDTIVAPEVRAALDEAYAVFRSLGATLEDARIRPAADYYAVKITIAESEQYAVHEEELRTRPGDFGADFLGRALPAVLYSGADYVQAQRERRLMLAEMAPIYEKYDLLVTPTAPGPAPRLGTWRTISFWQNASLTTPFNVTGGPALAQCMGVHAGRLAAVIAARRPSIRRGERAARRACLRNGDKLASPQAQSRFDDGFFDRTAAKHSSRGGQ